MGYIYSYKKRRPIDDVACLSSCDNIDMVKNRSCSGIGYCETSILEGLSQFYVVANNMGAPSKELAAFNPCTYAFIVEEKAYNFSFLDFRGIINTLLMVVNWAVGNHTCHDAQKQLTSYACKAMHSECYIATNSLGHHCKCASSFPGNPYLLHDCQGINIHIYFITRS